MLDEHAFLVLTKRTLLQLSTSSEELVTLKIRKIVGETDNAISHQALDLRSELLLVIASSMVSQMMCKGRLTQRRMKRLSLLKLFSQDSKSRRITAENRP